MNRGTCKSCKASILWARTPAGKAMPLDPDPVLGGNVALDGGGTAVVLNAETVEQERAAGRPHHVSHWATCPTAPQHRKPRHAAR